MNSRKNDSSNRRTMAKVSAAVALGVHSSIGRGAGRNDRIRLGFIGCGSRAKSLIKPFLGSTDVAWACDPDQERLAQFATDSNAEHTTTDLRQVIGDPKVDAVVIATPDHWHAPAAIMACEAGKHVYVEKPCSHNLREGRLLLEAARRNNVIVQHGTQYRSSPFITDAITLLREGMIGDVLSCKAWNVQRRRNIGHAKPTIPPDALDYPMWVGPAEWMPYQKNRLHYDWHWWHNFGTGDLGNDGVHEMDMARWGLAVKGLPTKVVALGGKYYFDDDQQFPDTATCTFVWGDSALQRRQLMFEMRLLSRNYPHNCDSGVEWYGTQGMLFVSKRGKMELWDDRNRPVPNPTPTRKVATPGSHQVNFLSCIRSGELPTADIEIGHHSASLCHLANIAVQRERVLHIDPDRESIKGDPDSHKMQGRSYRKEGHWAIPEHV